MDPTDFPTPQPREIGDFSPSLANQLLACPLRAAFSRDAELRTWQRSNTYSALGLVAHKVNEAAFSLKETAAGEDAIRDQLEALWDAEVAQACETLRQDWAPASPPPSEDWPSYQLTRTRTIRRLAKFLANRSEKQRSPQEGFGIETWLHDPTTGLVGRADRIEHDGDERRVVDLKTGLHQEEPTDDQRRQLLLYAVLVNRTTNEWPRSIAIENASGTQYRSSLDPEEAEAALGEVQRAIAHFNAALANPASLLSAATPSSDTCRWCAYRVVCGPYWSNLSTDWNHGAAACGTIIDTGSADDGNYLRLNVESPTDLTAEEFHISQLAVPVPESATRAAVVDGAGASGALHVRGRWSTTVRAW